MTNSLCYFQKGAECCEENTPESLIRIEYDAIDGYYIYLIYLGVWFLYLALCCTKVS